MNINIIVALKSEAKHILKSFNINEFENEIINNIIIYSKKLKNKNIQIFINGKHSDGFDKIGTVPAAILTYKSILETKPDLILNIGTCGGIQSQNVNLFDIFCAENFVLYHDRNMSDLREMYSIGNFKCNSISSNNNFKYGVLATGNSIQLSENSWKIIERYNVKAVDMEAAAIAEIANEHNIDFSAVKVITDLVNKEIKTDCTVSQFKTNFHKAMEHLSKHVVTLIHDL